MQGPVYDLSDDGGGGSDNSGLERRVARLETAMTGVLATLGQLQPLLVRLDERTTMIATMMATKEDMANLRADLATKASVEDVAKCRC